MGTLKLITKEYLEYATNLKGIRTESQEEFVSQVKNYREQFIDRLEKLRDEYPETIAINYSSKMTTAAARRIVDRIADNVRNNYSFPVLQSDTVMVDRVMKDVFCVPSYMSLNSFTQLHTDKAGINDWLIMLLLCMPAKSVNLHIVDTEGTMLTDFIYSNIHKSYYGGTPVKSESEYEILLETLNNRVISCVQKYTDLVEYNESHKIILMPYEVVVLISEPKNLRERVNSLKASLAKNGAKGGVYIVAMSMHKGSIDKTIYLTDFLVKNSFYAIKPTPITTIPALIDAALNYLNECATSEVDKQVVTMDVSKAANSEYKNPDKFISTPVGKDGQEECYARFDLVSHVHSFVVGQSGSGKSVFLHNVISGIMLNYSPDDVELYLMDFKLGGVEFNRYRDEKHVHAMMVDNSDYLVTLEILRDLKNKMIERGRLFREKAVTNIAEYNKCVEEHIRHIILVADECHELFRRGTDIPHAVSTEINEILTKIAKEGRNQGVHMMMATQTLSGTEISNEILANITDFYLLKCSSIDSEKLVPRSSKHTSNLATGNIYYQNPDGSTTFQAYYTDKASVDVLMATILEKSKKLKSNFNFYFNGSTVHKFNDDVITRHLRLCKKYPVAFVGKSIDLNQEDVRIVLKDDISENILVLGQNDEEQSTRTVVNIIQSIIKSSHNLDDLKIYVIDCLRNDDGKYQDYLDDWCNEGSIEIIKQKNKASFFHKMAKDILSGVAGNSIVVILGQDRFRELKLNLELEDSLDSTPDESGLGSINISFDHINDDSVKTYSDAVRIILEKGPETGVHTVLQLEKASNYLFMEYLNTKELYKSFKHLVLLKSDPSTTSQLRLDDDIRLERLSKDEDRLRAYYYSEEIDNYTLFTPYLP